MRPASEIHSSLDLAERERVKHHRGARKYLDLPLLEFANLSISEAEAARQSARAAENLSIVCDVLRWVVGAHWVELTDGENPWLAAYLLDDPPKLDNTPPEVN